MRVWSVVAAALIAGCTSHPVNPDGSKLTLKDAGPPPADPVSVVNGVLKYRLRDFDSAKIEVDRPPRRVVVDTWGEHPGGAGWELCPNVNAKNTFGAYTGYQRVFILWKGGKVVDTIDGDYGDFYCTKGLDGRLAADR